ncbi:MAG: UvrD-helicase domain-containing protein, partial [Calditerrivibrio sp.]|nr:UvrD-helicase domain-containing protein [Calditerrivibrio sp.]
MTLKLLNESQLEAIRYNDGPLLVIAGAGTGKTRVITNKIAYLIKDMNVSPENILAVTFTNKAADEMARRIFQLTDKHSKNIWIGTFHSIALRMLRRDGYLVGLKSNFSVIDQDDRLSIIRDILKNINIDSKKYPPKNYLNLISNYKNSMEFIDEIEPHEDFYKFEEVFNNYQHSLREMNMVDFDDMLSLIVKVLKYNPEIKYYYRKIFQYILVDEFQDTNRIQLEFLTSICDKNGFITAVGDDDQSIYGWRGAEIRNILNFEEYFPATKIVKLTDNYRSGHKILTTANKLISNNKFRKGKDLKPFIKEHGDIIIKQFHTEIDEAIFVAGKIRDLLNLGVSAEEIAILYRANSQSRNFEVELNRLG